MTIYEPEDFYKTWDPRWMKFSHAVDKLRKMRTKIAQDNNLRISEGIPTSIELDCWFNQ